MPYHQLTLEEREVISQMHSSGTGATAIARSSRCCERKLSETFNHRSQACRPGEVTWMHHGPLRERVSEKRLNKGFPYRKGKERSAWNNAYHSAQELSLSLSRKDRCEDPVSIWDWSLIIRPIMEFILQPWQLILVILAGWINRQQQKVIEYLRTENQVLKQKLGKKRILLDDDQ